MTKTYGNFTDFIDFSRASSGTALRKVSYGTELVTNGTFDTDTSGWVPNSVPEAPLSMDGQKLKVTTYSAGKWNYGYQIITTEINKVYRVQGDFVSGTATSGRIFVGTSAQNNAYAGITSAGALDECFVATTTTTYITLQNTDGVTGSTNFFDNISVKEVTFDQADGTLELFNHPDNVPRIEYDVNGNVKGLLIEEARTNLVTTSEALSGGNWFNNGGTITENAVTAPDGTLTGNTYSTDGSYRTLRNVVTVSPSTSYTWSFYAKNIDATDLRYRVYDNTNAADIVGSVSYLGQVSTATWTRIDVTFTTPATCTNAAVYVCSGDQGGTAAFWGAQLEQGSFPTSYIPTSGSSVTRSADIASIATANFGYNQKAGTVVVETVSNYLNGVGRNFTISDGTLDNRIQSAAYYNSHFAIDSGGTPQASLDAGTYVQGQYSKLAGGYKTDDVAAVIDGGSVVSDSSATIPSGVTTMTIGCREHKASNYLNGHIKSIKYLPRRNTNTQLQEFTS